MMLNYIFDINWIIFNDISLYNNGEAYLSLREITGFSWNTLTNSQENILDQNGSLDFPSYMAARWITLSWEILWDNLNSIRAKWNEILSKINIPYFYKNRNDWYFKMFFWLPWDEANKKYIYVKVNKLPKVEKPFQSTRKLLFLIEFRSEDPMIYTELATKKIWEKIWWTLPMSLPTNLKRKLELTCENIWNFISWTEIKISWPCASPSIQNVEWNTFFWLKWLVLNEWEYVTINSQTATIIKNWTEDISYLLEWNSEWIYIIPWLNKINFFYVNIDPKLPIIEVTSQDGAWNSIT